MLEKIFKLFVLLVFLLPLNNLYSQDVSSKDSDTKIDFSAEESSFSLDESDFSDVSKSNSDKTSTLSTVWVFVKMIIMLAVVVACVYGVFFLLRRSTKASNAADPFLRKVSQISLSPGKSVQVVTLLDNAYIIGVTDESINLIGQVNDKELVNSMNLYADKNDKTSKPRTFADVLDIFMPHGPRSENVFGTGESATDTMRKQRERFNRNGFENLGKGE